MLLNDQQIKQVVTIAEQAAAAIRQLYETIEAPSVEIKADHTPVTSADLAADVIIRQGLQQLSSYPVLSEENIISYEERQHWESYWLVDPLDGTKEFIERTGEFSINIALISHSRPIFGLIYAPLTKTYCYAWQDTAYSVNQHGQSQLLKTRLITPNHLTVTMSRRHGRKKFQVFTERFNTYDVIDCGSALKFGLLANGSVDLYPRFGPSSEWDTAAGQCIVEAAGGKIMNLQGDVLQYNTKSSLLNPEFIAVGDPHYPWLDDIQKILGENYGN